jgi:hypothetical protein
MRVEAAPRLLFVDNHLEDFLRNRIELAHRMKRAGFEVHAAVPNTLGVGKIAREGICVHTFYLQRTSDQLFDELRCLASLFALYKRVAPTLVHHISLKPILYGGIAARLAGVPAVISTLTGLGHLFATHTKKTYFLQRIVASGLRFAFGYSNHRVIVQNADDHKYLFAKCGMNVDRLALIKGSGINLSLYVPRPEVNGVPVVLMAARSFK